MNALRQSFLDSLRTSGKELVAKSAAAPPMLAIRSPAGEIMGFGTPEAVSVAEAERIAGLSADRNAVFDDSAVCPFGSNQLESRESVQKSAPDPTDPNSCFTSLLPWRRPDAVDVAKSVDGTELMNRVAGRNEEDAKPAGKPGRPATAKAGSPLDNFDPANPQTVLATDGKNIKAGSVLAVCMPDGSMHYLVLMADCPADILLSTEGG